MHNKKKKDRNRKDKPNFDLDLDSITVLDADVLAGVAGGIPQFVPPDNR